MSIQNTKLHGFTLIEECSLTELSSRVRMWRHDVTGAQLLSFCNDDENKVFGVSFRTPPTDSTGVAHILEHSVLCGSERFPVKEPFVELLKGSLQTFLNAFTYPDKTCYPVASANTQDFYNLMDVYLDAVFFPRISENIFRQEGWHIAAESADEPWAYKGVVYNEMKGVYSSPDSILSEQSQQSLFEGHLYGLDSGGAPEHILELTYKQFVDFHKSYYHPANARFFFWGDDDEAARLEKVNAALASFGPLEVTSQVPLMEHRDVPLHAEVPYAASEDEDRGMVTMNWLLGETAGSKEAIERNFALQMLEHILLGLPGSPLRRALIESGLGEDVTGCGLESELRQMYFSVGLKGIDPFDAPKVEMCIMESLAALAEEGIPADAIDAAFNSVEFSLRENNTGRFPRGLAVMLRSLSTWLYDGDALALLRFNEPLKAIAANIKATAEAPAPERYFEKIIEECFLQNQHRSTVCLLPDAKIGEQRADAEKARIARVQSVLTAEDKAAVVALAAELQAEQELEDSPEALATIPSLGLEDIPSENRSLPIEIDDNGAIPMVCHDVDTSGIVYAELLFNMEAVPANLLPLVPLYGRALFEMGTQKRDFVELGVNIAAKTGGIDADTMFLTDRIDREAQVYMVVGGKATLDKAEDLVGIMGEVLLEPNFTDQERFGRMVLEEKARMEQSLVPSGHSVVATRLRAHYSMAGWLDEMTGGVSYLLALRELSERCVNDWDSVLADLHTVHGLIVRRESALANVTLKADLSPAFADRLQVLGASLPSMPAAKVDWAGAKTAFPEAEALLVPAQVNYVGKAANLYDFDYEYHGSCNVIMKHLRMAYLWDRVRVQGGAYGAFCAFDRMSGVLTQVSYRDPNISRTLDAYDGAAAYLREVALDERQIAGAIIGAIGELDTYLLPDAKGHASLVRHLAHDDEATRQRMREEILATSAEHFRAFADVLEKVAKSGNIVVLGGAALAGVAKEQGWTELKAL
ncbi:MAG: insulinase family protein [Pseudomonadota bacterium]